MRTAVAGTLLAAVLAATATAGAEPTASRIIDRTLVCVAAQSGGIYEIEARANAGVRRGSRWHRLPFGVVTTGNVAAATEVLQNSLAWISAGRPDARTQLGEHFYPVLASAYGTFALNRRICTNVSTRIPLSPAGLSGGVASQLGETFDCESPRRVLVRVRASFARPAKLSGHDAFFIAEEPIREARVAVRTQSGRPLIYATVAESGKSTLHTAKGCLRE